MVVLSARVVLLAGALALTGCVTGAHVYDDPTDAYYFGGDGTSWTVPQGYYRYPGHYGYPTYYGYRSYYGMPSYYGPYAYPPRFPYYGHEHPAVRPRPHRDPHHDRDDGEVVRPPPGDPSAPGVSPVPPPPGDRPCAGRKNCGPSDGSAEPEVVGEHGEPAPGRRRNRERRVSDQPVEE